MKKKTASLRMKTLAAGAAVAAALSVGAVSDLPGQNGCIRRLLKLRKRYLNKIMRHPVSWRDGMTRRRCLRRCSTGQEKAGLQALPMAH